MTEDVSMEAVLDRMEVALASYVAALQAIRQGEEVEGVPPPRQVVRPDDLVGATFSTRQAADHAFRSLVASVPFRGVDYLIPLRLGGDDWQAELLFVVRFEDDQLLVRQYRGEFGMPDAADEQTRDVPKGEPDGG